MNSIAWLLLACAQVVLAWNLRSGWVSFDAYALLSRAADQPYGDPFHLAVPSILSWAHALVRPLGWSTIESATLVSCVASGVTVAAVALWCMSKGSTRAIACLMGLLTVWTPATAHAALGVEVNSLQMAACAVTLMIAARYAASPSLRVLAALFIAMTASLLMHVGSLALIPGWLWIALRAAPASHRRLACVVAICVAALLVIAAIQPFKVVTATSPSPPTTILVGEWVWLTVTRPRANGGLFHTSLEWVRNGLGLIGVPILLAIGVTIRQRQIWKSVLPLVVLPALVFIATGTSWLGLTLPAVGILVGPISAGLSAGRLGTAIAGIALLVSFGLSAEVGPGGPGYRLRHFSDDPLTQTANALAAMLPPQAALIAGNSAAPLRFKGMQRLDSVAELVADGAGCGLPPLAAVEARAKSLQSKGIEVWISKDALDYLESTGTDAAAVLSHVDMGSIRRSGPDEARLARWR